MYGNTYTQEHLRRDQIKREAEILGRRKDQRLREIVLEISSSGVQCNCDLDRYEPERSTGHSFVCRIHTMAQDRIHTEFTGGLR